MILTTVAAGGAGRRQEKSDGSEMESRQGIRGAAPFHGRVLGTSLLLFSALAAACGPVPEERSLLVVVNYGLYHELEESLERYARGLESHGVQVHVEPWAPGTASELRSLIFTYVDEEKVEGALLVGSLPAAWYEQDAFGAHEEFPTDIVLQDRDAAWLDSDTDGVYDAHTPLELEIYTSRLDGTVDQLRAYFERVEHYRQVGPLVDVLAFVFIDDPWQKSADRQSLHLDEIYDEVLVMHEPSETTLESYTAMLTGGGAEYVYQAVHSGPYYMNFIEQDATTHCYYDDICEGQFKASFLNLFNCSAARFTEKNLANAYIVGTAYGLALVGSTKTGAIWDSRLFHKRLSDGRTWGQAYIDWYNAVGVWNDNWHLGITLMGDPLLRLHGDQAPPPRSPSSPPWLPWLPPAYDPTMFEVARTARLGTFEEYRAEHPEFFED